MTSLNYIIAFLFGSAIGSFAGVCLHRIPLRRPITLGLSRCDHCGAPLTWTQKLPLLGYFRLAGHAYCCGVRIPARYIVLEVLTGALFALLYWRFETDAQLLAAVPFLALLVVSSTVDLYHRIIPDKISLPGILLGLALAFLAPAGGPLAALTGLLACGGFLYFCGWLSGELLKTPQTMGGGDIKLAAMIGTFLGWQGGLLAVVLAAFAGTVFGSASVAVKGISASRKVPFAPFLSAGALAVLFWQQQLFTWILNLEYWL